jgi:putative ABC transport system permease protein
MSRMVGIRRLFRLTPSRASIDRAVDDELQFHFDMTTRELMANGMTPDDARREAERRFGDVSKHRERLAAIDRAQATTVRRVEWWSGVAQDVRYAVRGVRLKPGFAAAIVLTLGLGIGANATMFGIVDRLLFRPPAHLIEPDRVNRLYFARVNAGKEFFGDETQYQRFLDISQSATTLETTAAYAPRRFAVGTGTETQDVAVGGATASLWSLFDVKPVIGRFFTADEDRPPNGSKVVVLSYSYWQTQFAGARSVVGQPLKIGPSTYTIIGVAPAGFAAMELETPAAFVPLLASADDAYAGVWVQCRTEYCLTWIDMYARRKPGVSVEAATNDLTRAFQDSYRKQVAMSPRTTSLEIAKPRVVVGSMLAQRGPNQGADTRVATWLLGVAGIVLLIACANVGNLLLGRALRRRREIAVRIALGVSRARLLRQLLIESLLLASLGCVAGLAIAQWGGGVLRAVLMPGVEWSSAIADPRVALFAAGIAVAAGLVCGLAPAVSAGRTDIATALKSGVREGHASRSRLRTSLLVTQAALSVVLLVGAGLFVRSLRNVGQVKLGYDADHLLWVEPRLRGTKLDATGKGLLRLALLDRAQHAPGATQAALDLGVPFLNEYNTQLFVAGVDSVERLGEFHQREVTPTFFETVGTRILRGRGITEEDRAGGPRAIVVSEAMAKALWPNQDALGKCIRVNTETSPCSAVVGVAENIKQQSLADDPGLTFYLAFNQTEAIDASPTSRTKGVGSAVLGGLFIRTKGPADAAIERVRRDLQQVMPGAGYVTVTSMSRILAPQMRSWQLGATMFAVFGALALVLAAVGLYSVVAYSVAQRMHEMGVRVALGAQARDVIGLVVGEGLRVVGPGIALGGTIALLAGRWIAPLLFNVSPKDPSVFASVVGTLLAVAVVGSWLPALRAAHVDPNEALRAD